MDKKQLTVDDVVGEEGEGGMGGVREDARLKEVGAGRQGVRDESENYTKAA